MYVHELEPVAGSLGLSALVAAVPLLIVLVLLGGVRMKAHLAGLTGLLAAVLVAVLVALLAYGMPLGQTLSSAAQGAVFGLFPILWIVVNALWAYRMTVRTGRFDILRRSFGRLSDDPRIQALVIAFCFGALLEALAGFGVPVAISAVMLVALGFEPVRAAVVALVANTAPVAFGAMGTPVVTLAQVAGLPLDSVASVVGRQTPPLALVVPLVLVWLVDGRRGLRETWVPALACGVAFAVAQFAASNYVSAQLADIGAALAGAGALVAVPHARVPAAESVRASVLTGVRSEELDDKEGLCCSPPLKVGRAAQAPVLRLALRQLPAHAGAGLLLGSPMASMGFRLRPTARRAVGAIDCAPHLAWSTPRTTGSTGRIRSCAFRGSHAGVTNVASALRSSGNLNSIE